MLPTPIVPPLRLMTPVAAVVVTLPPVPQASVMVPSCTVRPLGRVSVKATPVSATVFAPSNAFAAVACYEGPTASSKACRSSFAPDRADFSATGALATGDQLTFVTSLRKGIVSGTLPILERRERGVEQYFDLTPSTEGAALLVMLIGRFTGESRRGGILRT